jgi:hypothetical protein
MKIYCINDDYWFAAETAEEAVSEASSEWGIMCDDEDGSNRTFREQLALLIDRGEKFPLAFAMRE